MRRRLILMRHAKSAWGSEARTDHERPLNERGERDAPRVAERLAELGWDPEAVYSSDSRRTRETWAGMADAFDRDVAVTFTPDLYQAGLDEIREAALEWPDDLEILLVLGHNPGWEDALSILTRQAWGMTTANAALLVGEGDTWVEALEGRWRLEDLIRPRDLG
ncbi:MAG: SixA phosphatase family protein [Myxococcota bacterium]